MSYALMNISFTAHCVGHTFFEWGEPGCFHSFDWLSSLVHMSEPRFRPWRWFIHESVTFPLVQVQQGLCKWITVLLLYLPNFMEYPMCCKFAVIQNVLQNVEHSLDTLGLPLLTHTQSIGDQHPTGKQAVEPNSLKNNSGNSAPKHET